MNDTSPQNHYFTPQQPGSTKCKWCMFAEGAHPLPVSLSQGDKGKLDLDTFDSRGKK